MSVAKGKFKVVLLGDEAAGKTSIVRRYMYDTFDEAIQATIGMDFQSKTVHLPDRQVRLQLWDTAGQERFRSLIPSYIRDAAVAVVVFDITKRGSFQGTRKWIDDVRNERGDQVIVALVGNKADLESDREVPTEEARAMAQELGATFAETSAKTGAGVKELFQELATTLTANQPAAAVASSNATGTGAAASGGGGGDKIKLSAATAPEAESKKKKKCCG